MFDRSGLITGMALAAALCVAAEPARAWQIEVGRVEADNTFDVSAATRITFQRAFSTPPVVVPLTTSQGGDSAILRVFNVTTTGFDVFIAESPGEDGPHVEQQFDYVAMEPGRHQLPSGETVAAGVLSTDLFVGFSGSGGASGWDFQSFSGALAGTPAVITALQSLNSNPGADPWNAPLSPFFAVAVDDVSGTGFDVAIDRLESGAGALTTEQIGWIAFPAGGGSFDAVGGGTVSWRSVVSGGVRGWDDGCFSVSFGASLSNARAVASMNTRNGANGGWLRRCSIGGSSVGLAVDEDVANDGERSHTNETVGLLAFSGDFHADFGAAEVSVVKTVSAEEDPINGDTGALAIPEGRLRYHLSIENTGVVSVDADTLVIVDALPAGVSLRVVDLTDYAPGTGPVFFGDGPIASGLSFTAGALNDATDDIAYSDDGGATFAYAPTPDGRGVDPAITHVRLTPRGAFAGDTGGGAPSFQILYDVVVN